MRVRFLLAMALVLSGAAYGGDLTADDISVIVRGRPLEAQDNLSVTQVSAGPATPASAQTFDTLASQVANLQLDTSGAGSFGAPLALRGLSSTPYFSDPAVSVYLDDLPLGNGFTYPDALFGFFDAAVWRGPQGTAFGRGGEGGVIVFSSQNAQYSDSKGPVSGELRASTGSFGSRAGAFSLRGTAGDFDASATGSYAARDGYIRNTTLDTRVDDRRDAAASVRVSWRPSDSAEFALQALGHRERDGAQPLVPLAGPRFTVTRDRDGSTDIDFGGVALRGRFDTAFGQLTSVTSRTSWRLSPYDNRLVLPPPLDSRIGQRQRTWNEELHLASPIGAAVAWNLGAWFSDSATSGDTDREIPQLFPIEVSRFEMSSRSAALFGEAAWAPTDRWQLAGGLRAERTWRDFSRSQTVPGPGFFADAQAFDALLPKLSATYAVSPNTSAQLTASLGQRPGGWSAYTANATLAPFKAEHAAGVEAALRTALAESNVQLTARAFAYAVRNYQIERSFTASDYLVVNAPHARTLGGEVEAQWQAGQRLLFSGSFGITRATLREFHDPFSGVNYAGNRAPYAPSYDASFNATYRTAHWFASGQWASVGRTFFDESENPLYTQAARNTLSARAGYAGSNWRIGLYGDNLTNTGYYTLIVPGVGHAVPGAPRTFGLELSVLKPKH